MVLPPPMQSSLPAGWLAFTGRASNPLDHNKRFQITHPPFLDLSWRYRDELPPPHWITSSAVANSDSGMVRPRALAVFKLMINSIFVACWTGRQVGRLFALENSAGVVADDAVRFRGATCVAHQAAGPHELATLINRGHREHGNGCRFHQNGFVRTRLLGRGLMGLS
jgi:hypothetical protein